MYNTYVVLCLFTHIYIHIYIYMCVCVAMVTQPVLGPQAVEQQPRGKPTAARLWQPSLDFET